MAKTHSSTRPSDDVRVFALLAVALLAAVVIAGVYLYQRQQEINIVERELQDFKTEMRRAERQFESDLESIVSPNPRGEATEHATSVEWIAKERWSGHGGPEYRTATLADGVVRLQWVIDNSDSVNDAALTVRITDGDGLQEYERIAVRASHHALERGEKVLTLRRGGVRFEIDCPAQWSVTLTEHR